MSTGRDQRVGENAHGGVSTLLPWYAIGTLSPEEDRRVEQHLAACPVCQEELEQCRRLSAVVKSEDEHAWAPSPAHFAQVMAHIDRAEATGATMTKRPFALLAKVRAWIGGTPRPMQWAFAVQGALILVMVGALVLTTVPSTSTYETLARPEEQVAANRAQLRVVFAEDVTGKELHDLLQGIDAQIVHGPSPTGVYTIQLPFAGTSQEQVNRALATLRTHPKVRLAEPIGSASTQ